MSLRIRVYSFSLLFISIVLLFSCGGTLPVIKAGKGQIIENVPFYPQQMFQCGPATLAEVFNFWGVKVSPEEIAREIYSKSARGTLTMDMVLYSQKEGFAVRQYSGGLEDIRKNVNLGYPLIVLVDNGFFVYQKNHFMVVLGYSQNGVFVHSGKEREKFIPLNDFLGPWGKADHWTLLVTPRDKK
jgi:ABC-type bacteriocin/lantibiotic exporter with double-glycine peptidase domain